VIADLFREAIERHPDKPFIVAPSGAWTFTQFYRYTCAIAETLDELDPTRLACHAPDSPPLVATLLAAALSGRSIVLFNHDYTDQQLHPLIADLGVDLLISDAETCEDFGCRQLSMTEVTDRVGSSTPLRSSNDSNEGEVLILTSGTTGTPKCARYRWDDLVAQITRSRSDDDERWLLAYRLNHFAGLQMLLHVLVSQQTLVLPESSKVAAALDAAKTYGVTHLSSTPTFWRFALAALPDATLPLASITLGSEAVSAALLDSLAERFPKTRIVHIYATTEAGSCVSVSDGRPGLPIAVLSRPEGARVQFKIDGQELLVKTNHGMQGYLDRKTSKPESVGAGWIRTGDLVRIEDDRIFFVGRKSEVINVGGVKVHPQEVETVITALPGVKLARAYGQANPVVGQIVAVDIIMNEGNTEAEVEDSVYEACRSLSRHSRPRILNFVETLSTNNYKLERR
jgi:acyl-CoA synthetase (AMP-forming)/AMP-acid ligase II